MRQPGLTGSTPPARRSCPTSSGRFSGRWPSRRGIVGTTKAALELDGRDVGLELRSLVEGDLAGMFDGPTTPGVEQRSGVLVVDLSAVYHSEALGALMVCASAWLQAMTARADARTILVVDEAWAILTELAVARYLRSSWKLARSHGLANIAVCHRASDLGASGPAGSEQSRLAEGLLADSETVVCYAQPASELPRWPNCSGARARNSTCSRGCAGAWRCGGSAVAATSSSISSARTSGRSWTPMRGWLDRGRA